VRLRTPYLLRPIRLWFQPFPYPKSLFLDLWSSTIHDRGSINRQINHFHYFRKPRGHNSNGLWDPFTAARGGPLALHFLTIKRTGNMLEVKLDKRKCCCWEVFSGMLKNLSQWDENLWNQTNILQELPKWKFPFCVKYDEIKGKWTKFIPAFPVVVPLTFSVNVQTARAAQCPGIQGTPERYYEAFGYTFFKFS